MDGRRCGRFSTAGRAKSGRGYGDGWAVSAACFRLGRGPLLRGFGERADRARGLACGSTGLTGSGFPERVRAVRSRTVRRRRSSDRRAIPDIHTHSCGSSRRRRQMRSRRLSAPSQPRHKSRWPNARQSARRSPTGETAKPPAQIRPEAHGWRGAGGTSAAARARARVCNSL